MKNKIATSFVMSLISMTSLCAQDGQNNREGIKYFENNIRPALVKYCYQCHSVEAGDSRAGLLVDTRKGLLQGGDNGPAVVPGDLDESTLWHAINWDDNEMPPSQQMPDEVIAHFKKWIEMGAPDPRVQQKLEIKTKITQADIEAAQKEHWAFSRPKKNGGDSIDKLIDARLAQSELKPTPRADAYTLLRRVHFDLIGLPPTPKEIDSFLSKWEKDPQKAIASKVDELLKRPQYGERWGRHWLDVARYAESAGSRSVSFPHAWRYRDYVIDSFNNDTPYDRFIAEQIAGDLLPAKNDEDWQRNLIATGFLAIGLKQLDQKNPRIFMADMVDEQIDTTTQAVMGMTVSCARCHDHKYDPIPTGDYYAMAGIFRSTKTFYGTNRVAQNHRPSDLIALPVPDKVLASSRNSRQSLGELKKQIADLDKQMADVGRGRKADGAPNKEYKRLRNVRNRLSGELATFDSSGTKITLAMGVQEADEKVNANILLAGEVEKPAQEVQRGFLKVFGDLNFTVQGNRSSGRRELANAMTTEENPLTARVMVNRIWMHLIGRPLVATPNNFGLSGLAPENQELLDFLAVRFMEGNWSIKAMIREIVLSDAYQRSSQFHQANYEADPDNQSLWRANTRQLDAEAMRDAILAFSGRIELQRPYASEVALAGDGKATGSGFDPNTRYRSVYLPILRNDLLEPLQIFDFPDPNQTSATRQKSILPTQALFLMNSEFVMSQARWMATSLEKTYRSPEERVKNAFLWVYGRPATDEEMQLSVQFFKKFTPSQNATTTKEVTPRQGRQRGGNNQSRRGRKNGRSRNPSQSTEYSDATATDNQALSVFCQTLMASARFRILN